VALVHSSTAQSHTNAETRNLHHPGATMFQALGVPTIDGAAPSIRIKIPGYELLEVIGCGGSAIVYRAYQRSADRPVAVKILRENGLPRFEREARIIGKLRHPNTIRLYDVGRTEDGDLYLVTELLHGRSLADVLSEGAFTPARAIEVVKQIAGSLSEAHRVGIIHRDIKPANVFLDRIGDDDVVKVLDFGIARELTSAAVSRSDLMLGSPVYMAPEQVSGTSFDHRADIYALGVLLHHLLSGRPPFGAATAQEMLAMHLTQQAPPIWVDRANLSSVHIALERLVVSMLEKSPDARPQSMAEVRAELDRIRAEPAIYAPAPLSLWARAGILMMLVAAALAVTATLVLAVQT
jgi:eukaryotic-like serine/threonine-protein kinase